jgi:Berberine and berberine like
METLMETVIQGSTLQTLRAGLRGTAHAPGEEGYEEASRAWNLAARQTPALVVVGKGDSKLIMNGIGPAFTPEMADGVVAYLARVADATCSFQTGDTYVNFMELEGASAERVKAAYAPEDFERLVALEDRYDPHNVFRFNRNIAPSTAEH